MNAYQAMARALELAGEQLGKTAPNPAVGCVILSAEGQLVGEGATANGGSPHAEQVALAAAGDAACGAHVFVTLEPCNNRSRGGPSCTDLLIEAGVAKVEVACRDPHPNAAGAGLSRLFAAGITVELGTLREPAEALNEGFFSVMREGVPIVRIAHDVGQYDEPWPEMVAGDLGEYLRARAGAGITRIAIAPGHRDITALRDASLLKEK
jgi:diaminohydroxyphosphoribosylaminopyrimidine deaminase/5-amino-6-(5-phosphoribosylamino)uracil reductase